MKEGYAMAVLYQLKLLAEVRLRSRELLLHPWPRSWGES